MSLHFFKRIFWTFNFGQKLRPLRFKQNKVFLTRDFDHFASFCVVSRKQLSFFGQVLQVCTELKLVETSFCPLEPSSFQEKKEALEAQQKTREAKFWDKTGESHREHQRIL